jgi:hypothetical protein
VASSSRGNTALRGTSPQVVVYRRNIMYILLLIKVLWDNSHYRASSLRQYSPPNTEPR